MKMHELEKIAPELSKIKRDPPFRVPENYFDNFPERLHWKVEAQAKASSERGGRLIQMLKPAIGLAAGLALLIILFYGSLKSLFPDYIATTNSVYESLITEEERIMSLIEKVDETSFFTLVQESYNGEEQEESYNDEELLSYLAQNVSEYEIYLDNEN